MLTVSFEAVHLQNQKVKETRKSFKNEIYCLWLELPILESCFHSYVPLLPPRSIHSEHAFHRWQTCTSSSLFSRML